MNFHLTKKALEDLKEIGRYTKRNWGIEQRNLYLKEIDDVFHLISKLPYKGKNCDEISINYYKWNIGKHIIFYRFTSKKRIEIVRILHSCMDILNHLNPT